MSVENYFKQYNLTNQKEVEDGMGGYEIVYEIGDSVKGFLGRASTSQVIVAQKAGRVEEQFNVIVGKESNLKINDVIYVPAENTNGEKLVKIWSDALINPQQSAQNYWKSYYGELFNAKKEEPVQEVEL